MTDSNFVVKNGLTVNGSFTANSTVVNAAAITATSANVTTLYINGVNANTIISGNAATAYANAVANTAALYQTTAGLSANVLLLSSNNSSYLGGVAAASYVNTSGAYTISGVHTHSANIVSSAVIAAGSVSLTTTNSAIINTSSIYVGNSSVSSFVNTTAFSGTSNNASNLGGVSLTTLQSQITGNSATAYSNAVANAAAIYAPKNIPTFTGLMTTANITSSYIGVNKSPNSSYALDANGDIRTYRNSTSGAIYFGSGPGAYWYYDGTNMATAVSCYAPNFVISSDARLKENVAPIFYTSLLVDSIEPKTFDFIEGSKGEIGFIAQEVQEYIPEAIGSTSDGFLAIKQSAMLAVLWEALRETRAELADLKMKVG